jgi:hypothetical protein
MVRTIPLRNQRWFKLPELGEEVGVARVLEKTSGDETIFVRSWEIFQLFSGLDQRPPESNSHMVTRPNTDQLVFHGHVHSLR